MEVTRKKESPNGPSSPSGRVVESPSAPASHDAIDIEGAASAPPSSSSSSIYEPAAADVGAIHVEPSEALVMAAMASMPSPPISPVLEELRTETERPPAHAPIIDDSIEHKRSNNSSNNGEGGGEGSLHMAMEASAPPASPGQITMPSAPSLSSSSLSSPSAPAMEATAPYIDVESKYHSSSASLSSSMASSLSSFAETKRASTSVELNHPHALHMRNTSSSDSKIEISPSPSPPLSTSPFSQLSSHSPSEIMIGGSNGMNASAPLDDDMMEPGAAEMVAAEDMILPTVASSSTAPSTAASVAGAIASYVPFSLSSLPGMSSLSSSATTTPASTASTISSVSGSESKYGSTTTPSLSSDVKRPPIPTTGLFSDRICTSSMRDMRDGIGELSDWFARKSTRLDGHFFRLVESFRQAQLSVLVGELHAKQATMQAEAQQRSLWKIVKKSETKSQACGDGAMTTHTIHYHVAEFDRSGVDTLGNHLSTLRVQAIQDLATKRFLAVSNQLRIEAFLHSLLSSHGINDLTSDTPPEPNQIQQQQEMFGGRGGGGGGGGGIGGNSFSYGSGSNNGSNGAPQVISQTSLAQLRSIIDVLFFFENKPADKDEEKLIAGYDDVREAEKKLREAKGIYIASYSLSCFCSMMTSWLLLLTIIEKKREEKKEKKEKKEAAGAVVDEDEEEQDTNAPDPSVEDGDTEKSRIEFQRSIRKWIKIMTDAIYRLGSLFEHRYVLQHVLRTRGAMQWCALLQCTRANQSHVRTLNTQPKQTPQFTAAKAWSNSLHGWVWTDEYRHHILSMLALMLSPLKVTRTRYSLAKRKAFASAPPGMAAAVTAAGIAAAPSRQKRRRPKKPLPGTATPAASDEKRSTPSDPNAPPASTDGKETGETNEIDGIRAWGSGATAAAAVDSSDEKQRIAERREREADDDSSSEEEEEDDDIDNNNPDALERKRALRTDSAMTAAALGDDSVMEARAAAWLEALPSADDIAGGWKLTEQDFANLVSDFPLMAFIRGLLLPLFVHHRRTAVQAAANMASGHAPSPPPSLVRQSSSDSGSSGVDPHSDLSDAFAKVRQVQALLAHALSQLREYPQFAKILCKYLVSLPKAVVEIYTEAMSITPTSDTFPMKPSWRPPASLSSSSSSSARSPPAYAPGFGFESKEDKGGFDEKKSKPLPQARKPVAAGENTHKGIPGATGLWIISDDAELAAADSGEGSYIGSAPRLGPARLTTWQQQVQAELDWLVLRGVCVIHAAAQPAVRFFIAGFPFLYISPWAAGQVFAIMFFNAPCKFIVFCSLPLSFIFICFIVT
jgi:uncharacterized membrane protein YgcG